MLFAKINRHGAKRNSPFATVNDDEIKIVVHFSKINGHGAKRNSPFATVNDDEIKIAVHFAKINGRGAKGNLPFAIVNGAEKNSGRLIKKGFSFYTKVLYKMKCTLVFTSCKFSSTQFWRCSNSGWPLRQSFLVAGDERDYLCADGTSTSTNKAKLHARLGGAPWSGVLTDHSSGRLPFSLDVFTNPAGGAPFLTFYGFI